MDTASRRFLAPLDGQGGALGVVAVGGALGALARHGVGVAVPSAPGAIPWSTFAVNVTGCLLIGALVVVVTEWRPAHPLLRPFLGTGVLGGYTTFSTYSVEVLQLAQAGHRAAAGGYLVGTLVAAVAATWLGARLARAVPRR